MVGNLMRDRRRSSAVLSAVIAPTAAFIVAGYAYFLPAQDAADSIVHDAEIVTAAPIAPADSADVRAAAGLVAGQVPAASRWRVIDLPEVLPAGVAPERGLQVKTILAARSISAVFPEIQRIGGVRPDPLKWHPHGLAIDVMIPNSHTAEGIALGNQIVAYVLKHADRFALQDAIWRGTYYTPAGSQRGGYGHYDHVHITTTGGGYPTGEEIYYR